MPVRIYGVCNGNPETTVLAHYRMAGICGTGMKPDDLIGAWACSACHDEIDRRTHNLDNKDARLYHLEGVIRTQAILLKEGRLSHENIPNKIAVASFKQPILATLKRIHYISDWGKRYRREVIEIIQQQQLDLKITPPHQNHHSRSTSR